MNLVALHYYLLAGQQLARRGIPSSPSVYLSLSLSLREATHVYSRDWWAWTRLAGWLPPWRRVDGFWFCSYIAMLSVRGLCADWYHLISIAQEVELSRSLFCFCPSFACLLCLWFHRSEIIIWGIYGGGRELWKKSGFCSLFVAFFFLQRTGKLSYFPSPPFFSTQKKKLLLVFKTFISKEINDRVVGMWRW